MSTPLKVLLGLLAAAVLAFVALVVTVLVIFEPEDYRAYLVQAVEDATGRPFELEGGLELDVLPCCSVALGPARLGNPAGFPAEPFASLERAYLSLRLWPLIARREVEIGTVTLQAAAVTLHRRADGRDNWTFAAADVASPADTEDGPPTRWRVGGIQLEDGRVRYVDELAGATYRITDIELSSGAVAYDGTAASPFPLRLSFLLADDAIDVEARLELAAEVAYDGQRIDVGRPALVLEAEGAAIPGGTARADASADFLIIALTEELEGEIRALQASLTARDARAMVAGGGGIVGGEPRFAGTFTVPETSPRALLASLGADGYRPGEPGALTRLAADGRWSLQGDELALETLDVRLDDARLTGSARVTAFGAGPVRLDLMLDALNLDRYLPAADAAGDPAVEAPRRIPLEALAETDLDARLRIGSLTASGVRLEAVRLEVASLDARLTTRLAANVAGGRVELQGEGPAAGDDPGLGGTLQLRELSPRRLLTAAGVPPATADPAALTRLAGSARWRLTPSSLDIEALDMQLDDSTFTGTSSIADFDTLATRFDVSVDRLDLDDYLPPEEDEAPADEPAATEIPVEAIRDLDLDGRLRAGRLAVLGLELEDVQAQVLAGGGVLRLDPLTAGLYGGRYQGRLVVDATGAEADLDLAQQLEGVQVGELIGQFVDTDVLVGSLSFELSGRGTGSSLPGLLEGLAGDVSLDLRDGVYRGMDVIHELRRARALLRNEAAPEPPAAPETPLDVLSASGRVEDGVLQTRRLTAAAKGLELTGRGGIDLAAAALDYRLDARLGSTAARAAGLEELAGLTIPLTLEGPVTGPKVGVDLAGLLGNTLRTTVEQRARQALMDRLGSERSDGASRDGESAPGEADEAAPQPDPGAPPAQDAPADEPSDEADPDEPPPRPSARELLERGLRDLLKPRPPDDQD